MMLPRTLVLAVPLALLLGAVPARAQSQDVPLTGVVRDVSGVSVPGVDVTVIEVADHGRLADDEDRW